MPAGQASCNLRECRSWLWCRDRNVGRLTGKLFLLGLVMSSSVCQHCRTPLSGNFVPGIDILCPRCKKLTRINLAPAPPPTPVAPPPAMTPPMPVRAPEAARTLPRQLPTTKHETSGRLLVTVLGAVVLLVGGGALLAWCLSGRPQQPQVVETRAKAPAVPTVPMKATVPVKPERKESPIETSMKLKGIAFLKKSQAADGTWPAGPWSIHMAAFGGLTLLECGLPPTDPAIQKAAALTREQRPMPGEHAVYGLSLQLLFLDRLNDPRDEDLIKHIALRLAAAMNQYGTYGYAANPLTEEDERALDTLLKEVGSKSWEAFVAENPKRAGDLKGRLGGLGMFRSPIVKQPPDKEFVSESKWHGDCSNTQFALLGLLAARRHKVPVDLPISLVVRKFRVTQEPEGHWRYSLYSGGYDNGAMTCAGLLGLAAGYGLDGAAPSKNPSDDPDIKRAITSLATSMRKLDRKAKGVPYYLLWSVERVGVLYGLQKIGSIEWYNWGLEFLKANQRDDGSWSPQEGNWLYSDTCFALLFLNQANLTKDLTDKLQALQALQQYEAEKNASKQ